MTANAYAGFGHQRSGSAEIVATTRRKGDADPSVGFATGGSDVANKRSQALVESIGAGVRTAPASAQRAISIAAAMAGSTHMTRIW